MDMAYLKAAEVAELHIADIRSKKFSIGKKKQNPLNMDLNQAVSGLSSELYAKDIHFIMELIQNAEDNRYPAGVEPTLEFVLTKTDITGTGAPATLLIFNNEIGFSKQNMESICSVGLSTKKGKRGLGFIGEKGIGFKSVFLVSCRPYIFSNGYRVRFSEQPEKESGIGYIVPEWVNEKPCALGISDVYGSNKVLPKTIIILPLKPDKVKAVEAQLSALHPEILLFLSKMKRLYVRGHDCDPTKPIDVSTVSISSVTNHMELREKHANSRIVHLSIKENMSGTEETCKYYLWRQEFPVKLANKVDARMDVDKWVIMFAFPCGNRLRRETSAVGVFAFLPTAMVTNFPYVIQADFMLASSRETIILDNEWNKGILECIPEAFVNAFECCLKEKLPSLEQVFTFLPAKVSPIQEFNTIRCSICEILKQKRIVLCSSLHGQRVFRVPSGVVRILPEFRNILKQFKNAGSSMAGLSSLEKYLLHDDLDNEHYTASLNFLGVSFAVDNWYANCITSCKIASMASDELYIMLLSFAGNRNFSNLALLRYINVKWNVKLCTLFAAIKPCKVRYAREPELHDWLIKCNREFSCPNNMFFLPNSTQRALFLNAECSSICFWLSNEAGVKSCSLFDYGNFLSSWVARKKDPKLAHKLAQFLYHSHRQGFIVNSELHICRTMPIVDGSNQVRLQRAATLVSATGSKWQRLFGPSNPFLDQCYVDIGEVYSENGHFAGEYVPSKELLKFLNNYSGAVDLEELQIPDEAVTIKRRISDNHVGFGR